MHILIQESQRKVGGRRENKNYVPETKEQRGGGPLLKSPNIFRKSASGILRIDPFPPSRQLRFIIAGEHRK
jgi:hypothetical protein